MLFEPVLCEMWMTKAWLRPDINEEQCCNTTFPLLVRPSGGRSVHHASVRPLPGTDDELRGRADTKKLMQIYNINFAVLGQDSAL